MLAGIHSESSEEMGGPCLLVQQQDGKRKIPAPACTDNFQVRAFEVEGVRFFSCEHAFQALKYAAGSAERQKIADIKPFAAESPLERARLVGCPSTQWSFDGKHHKWADWNGRIQMLIREELRPEGERNADLVASLHEMFRSYSDPGMS